MLRVMFLGMAIASSSLAAASNDNASSTAATQETSIGDAEIAHIAYTAGQLDIMAAQQALERSTNEDVRAFAATMLRDHKAVNDLALALVTKLGVTPQANPVSQSLTDEADAVRARITKLSGRAFDRAYIEREVGFHAAVNEALRSTLIPAAQNPELKDLLEQGLALFSAHQQHAEDLASELQ
ncbi:MAG: hypothetical protein APF82_10130 [Sphingomonadales bacterium BRH_c42]|nr:MAG: hypothetical protein APF82_10130 [Sphingomonadales bacterium BRH_c42]